MSKSLIERIKILSDECYDYMQISILLGFPEKTEDMKYYDLESLESLDKRLVSKVFIDLESFTINS